MGVVVGVRVRVRVSRGGSSVGHPLTLDAPHVRPRPHPHPHDVIADQMKRTATSVVANIAEGENRRSPAEKRQRFTDARAEAGETEAWLEILVALNVATDSDVAAAETRPDRVAAMLTKLIRRQPG